MSLWDYNDRNHGKKCALCGTVDGENRTAHVLGDDHTCECGYKPTQQKNVFDNGEYEIVLYASNENVIKSVWYTADGEYNGHTDYLYDENWNCIRENFYTWDGVLWSYSIYENNEKGQRVKSSNYSGEGELYGYEVNEYNSLGKISGITWYDSNGQAERYVNYEYDENENMIKEIEGDTDGNKYIGEYDSEGKLLRDIIEGNDGGKSVIEYEYDANGNNIKSVSRYYDESGTPIYTSTEIYDENGNTVVEENVEHYPDGDVVLKYLYECDENGLRIKETRYVNDELEYISNYTYNEYGQEISSVESDAEGEITRTTKTEYYDNGNRKSYIRYYDDSDVIEDESYFYENGAVQTVRIYDTSGVLCEESHYDEDGNLIEQESL